MERKRRYRGVFANQEGSVLVGSLILVLAVTLIGLGLYQAAVVETRQVGFTETGTRASYAAESGVNRAGLDVAWDTIGTLTFNGVYGSLTGTSPSNAPLVSLSGSGYGSTCFGSTTCTSSSNPQNAAYMVEAQKAFAPDGTAYTDRFWLISTACVPGPAADPCTAGSVTAAQVKALILQGAPTVTSTTTTTTTTTTIPAFPDPLMSVAPPAACPTTGACMSISGGSTQSYNSRQPGCTAPCVPSPLGGSATNTHHGSVFSNGNINFSGGTVDGNMVSSTDMQNDPSDIAITGGATVSGSVTAGGQISGGTAAQDHPNSPSPQITQQTLPNCATNATLFPGGFTTLTPCTVGQTCPAGTNAMVAPGTTWSAPTAANSYTLTISSGSVTLVGGSFCMNNIKISGGSLGVTGVDANNNPQPTVVMVDGTVTTLQGNFVNTTKDPQNFQLVSTYGNDAGETSTSALSLHGTTMYMTVYAPMTTVTLTASSTLIGAVAGAYVDMKAGSAVYYDDFLNSGLANIKFGPPTTFTTTITETITTTVAAGGGSYSLVNWRRSKCTQASALSAWSCS